jgi:DNA-directed RNA polymerase II subunit RPB2
MDQLFGDEEMIPLRDDMDEDGAEEIGQEDAWTVISSFFEEKGLARQQLDSFNEFIQHTMQEIVGASIGRKRNARDLPAKKREPVLLPIGFCFRGPRPRGRRGSRASSARRARRERTPRDSADVDACPDRDHPDQPPEPALRSPPTPLAHLFFLENVPSRHARDATNSLPASPRARRRRDVDVRDRARTSAHAR